MNLFLERIRSQLSQIEVAVLDQVNPFDFDELQSLVMTYPELASIDVRIPLLSNIAVQLAAEHGIRLDNAASLSRQAIFSPKLGALQPVVGVRHSVGLTLSPPPIGAPTPFPATPRAPIDLRLPHWPVRDQNPRGTCVAFAATACREITQQPLVDLSEQFLYWAIKDHHDGQPNVDGTWLNFAKDALFQDGISTEVLCPYQTAIPPSVHVGGPTPT